MLKSMESLLFLLTVFEQVMEKLVEERAKRWQSALSGTPRGQRDPSPQLLRLKAGAITVDEFLRATVERALAPLRGALHEDDIAFLREWALERLDDDPVLTALVERITKTPGGEPTSGQHQPVEGARDDGR